MALTNRVATSVPGLGTPIVSEKREDQTVTASATVALPATGGFTPKCRAGVARFKAIKNSGTSVTIALRLLVSDGTTTRFVDSIPATVADDNADVSIPVKMQDFEFDRLSFVFTTGGTTPNFNVDVEFAGTP